MKVVEQHYLPKKILEFIKALPSSAPLKKHSPIEVSSSNCLLIIQVNKNTSGENLHISCDLKGWPALTIPGFKVLLKLPLSLQL